MASSTPTVRPRRHATVVFIAVTLFIDMLSFGIVIPVLPHLIVQLVGGSISRAAVWTSGFGVVFMLMQFLCSPILGAFSDRFGRRLVILISCCGLGIDFIVMALAPNLWILLVGRVLSGTCTSSAATSQAYVADVTPPEKRTKVFGLLMTALGIGFIIGPGLGGWLGHIWIRLPFWVAALLSLTNFCYGLLVLPESLPKEHRTPRIAWKLANPIGALKLLKRDPQIFALAAVILLISLASYSINSTFVLYTDYRFAWDSKTVGFALMLIGACTAIVRGGLIPLLESRVGEYKLILAGLGFPAVGYALFCFAPASWLLWLGIPFLCLGGLAGPPLIAIMTRQVGPTEQGRLQGALSSLNSLTGIFGPLLFANLFALFISKYAPVQNFSGVSFAAATVVVIAALLLAAYSTRNQIKLTSHPVH